GILICFNGIIALLLNARISDLRADLLKCMDDMRTEFRELLAAARRATDARFKHVFDKLEEFGTRFARLEAKAG
ncbi:MAG: hypothetical protein JJE04_00360, partial [Acidobacteriia bacterium]|nr:hypothetical protein [Terriglobia bacterium]